VLAEQLMVEMAEIQQHLDLLLLVEVVVVMEIMDQNLM
jgi:hypothetical protein